METKHTETAVEKAVAFVKDMFGVETDPAPEEVAKPEVHDAEPEITDAAMSLDPNVYEGLVPPESGVRLDNEIESSDTERLKREVDEYPSQKGALELNAESAWHEENG